MAESVGQRPRDVTKGALSIALLTDVFSCGMANRAGLLRRARIVLVIVPFAIALAVGAYWVVFVGFSLESKVSPTVTMMTTIAQGLQFWALKHAEFPERLEQAASHFPSDTVPTDAWGNQFMYARSPTGGGWVLVSLGADGRVGGVDNASDLVLWSDQKL